MKPRPAEISTDVLAGLVERVTFHNEENGFAVLRLNARGKRDLVTVVGHEAIISAGGFIQASGDWNNDWPATARALDRASDDNCTLIIER
ncbi:YrrC family ATP-dependent DNA helicase [Mesorhizobium xinjiangense]|uniref:YrrC family ATP-dependent DNA helicase n=1 Tax=Mesorhizobium xinjiangense TaxID=2678685 RepID=UPI0018DCFD3D|nr:hypothetical protein [Mesorhizobium xinjiangense]